MTITGTGEPDSSVTVKIGDKTETTKVGDDGTWSTTFDDDTFPGDGTFDVGVQVKDPAGGDHTLDGPNVTIDLTAPVLAVTDGTTSAGDITNKVDFEDGVELAGTGEAGATVTVAANDVTKTTKVGSDGTWAISFTPTELPSGEVDIPAKITATDAIGNSTTIDDTIRIDTVPNPITINASSIGGDGVVNETELAQDFDITGTSAPGAKVTVAVGGLTQEATTDASGAWTVSIAGGALAAGEYDVTVTASTVDAAGNPSSTTGGFTVDTVGTVTVDTSSVEGDGVVNAVEQSDGVTLTGTAQVGSTVSVAIGTATHAASVDASGNWSVDIPASDVPTGEQTVTVTATATDGAGNVTTASGDLNIDTLVSNHAITSTHGGSDGVINATEATAGLAVSGTSEPGSSLEVRLGTAVQSTTVAADGSWPVTFAPADLPSGEHTLALTATAQDAAGNTAVATSEVKVDTDAGTLTISPDPVEGDDVINGVEASDGVVLKGTSDPGATVTVDMAGVSHTVTTGANGQWQAIFAPGDIKPGTYTANITATKTDAAGNTITATDTVQVDTQVDNLSISANAVEGDDIITGAEAADGVVVTGTTEPGSTVNV